MVTDFPAVRQLLHLAFIRHAGVVGKGAASAFTDTLTLDEFWPWDGIKLIRGAVLPAP